MWGGVLGRQRGQKKQSSSNTPVLLELSYKNSFRYALRYWEYDQQLKCWSRNNCISIRDIDSKKGNNCYDFGLGVFKACQLL